MKFYLRAINPDDFKNEKKFLNLPGDSICYDWNCSNGAHNEWSLFEIDNSINVDNQICRVIGYLFITSYNMFADNVGISFLKIPESELNKKLINPSEVLFGVKHINYSPVSVGKIKKALKYSFKNVKFSEYVLNYDLREIYLIFDAMLSDSKTNLEFFESIPEINPKLKSQTIYRKLDEVLNGSVPHFSNYCSSLTNCLQSSKQKNC